MFSQKSLFYLFLVISCTQWGCSAKSYIFKSSYLPNTTYRITMTNDAKTEMDLLDKNEGMNHPGMELPTQIDMVVTSTTLVETGTENTHGNIPLELTFEKFNVVQKLNGQEQTNPDKFNLGGLKIFATANQNNKIKIDKIEGREIDDIVKITLPSMIENLTQNIKFPENPVKIGDQFTLEIPMQMPVANMPQFNTKTIMTCKLTKVEKDLAYFDISQKFEMLQESGFEITGSGEGKFTYDLTKNFYVEYHSKSKMNLQAKMEIVNLKSTMNMNISSIAEVIKTN